MDTSKLPDSCDPHVLAESPSLHFFTSLNGLKNILPILPRFLNYPLFQGQKKVNYDSCHFSKVELDEDEERGVQLYG